MEELDSLNAKTLNSYPEPYNPKPPKVPDSGVNMQGSRGLGFRSVEFKGFVK